MNKYLLFALGLNLALSATAQNKMQVSLSDGNIEEFNTSSISNVQFYKDNNNCTITLKNGTVKQYDGNVSHIGFKKQTFKVYHFNFVYGRPFAPTDSVSPICIISQDISEQLFGKGVNPVGKVLSLGSDLRIVGVIEPTSSIAEQSFGQLFIPAEEATNMITIVLKEGCSLADLKQELEEIAHKRSVSSKNLDYSFENRILPHAQISF